MRAPVASSSRSLVLFTVLVQAAAGTGVMRLALPWLLPRPATAADLEALSAPLLPTALGLLVLATLAAAPHLGRPRAARLAVAHLGGSWLSREILLAALLGLVLAADLALRLLGAASDAVGAALAVSAALLGLATVYAMARLYRLRTVPAWDAPATTLAFFGTTVEMGAAAAAVVLVLSGGPVGPVNPALRALGLLAAATAAAGIVVLLVHLRALRRRGGAAAESARHLQDEHGGTLALRVAGGAIGGVLLLGTTWPLHGTEAQVPIVFASGLLLISELLGRALFFAAHRRAGL